MTPQIYSSATKPPVLVRSSKAVAVSHLQRCRALPLMEIDFTRIGGRTLSGSEDVLSLNHRMAIQVELRKVLESPIFVQSTRLSRFLSFAVEMALEGNGDSLKEYTIGVEAYGRRPEFEPCQDSIVRTEARRLRGKLKQYYQDEGQDDPVFIYFRPGSYVPIFHLSQPSGDSPREVQESEAIALNATSIYVAPFSHSSGDVLAEACARGLTDELMHSLTQTAGVRVFASRTWDNKHSTESKCEWKDGSRITLEGSVRTEENRVRVMSRLCDVDGRHLASWRSDFETNPERLFDSLERIALEIAAFIETTRRT